MQTQCPQTTRTMRSITICIFAILTLAMTSLAQQNSADRVQTVTRPTQSASPESPISGTNAVVKLLAVKDNASPASEYNKPDSGKKLIAVQIVVDNRKGTEDLDVSGFNFKLKDAEGGVYDVSLSDSSDQPTLKSGSVDAGDLVKGWITFEVDTALKAATFKIRYELADNKTAWIQLSTIVK